MVVIIIIRTFATLLKGIGAVAQLNRASDYGSEGLGFESLQRHKVSEGWILPILTYFVVYAMLSCGKKRGSRNLVGIAIQLSDSEQEKLLVGYSMLISPEKFDFGIE